MARAQLLHADRAPLAVRHPPRPHHFDHTGACDFTVKQRETRIPKPETRGPKVEARKLDPEASSVLLNLLFGDDRNLFGKAGRRLLNRLLSCFTLSYFTVKQVLSVVSCFTVKQVMYGMSCFTVK